MLLILFYLSVSLEELNFEVRIYKDFKRKDVLRQVQEGAQVKFREMKQILHVMSYNAH